MLPEIIEADNFWFVQSKEEQIEDNPFSGLDGSYVSALESSYWKFCHGIHSQENFLEYRNQELSDFCILENYRSYGEKPKANAYEIKASLEYKKFVKQEENYALREYEQLEKQFELVLRKLLRYIEYENITDAVREKFASDFETFYRKAWLLGRKASGIFFKNNVMSPSSEEETWFKNTVKTELAFWNKFLTAASKDKLLHYSAVDRIEMYVQAMKAMFQAGRVGGLPNNVLLSWYPQKKVIGKMCAGCEYMVNHSPFTPDTMPTVPRGGDTPCLFRCVHRVVVRYASEERIMQRKQELPSKEQMQRELEEFMTYKSVRIKNKSATHNPWVNKKWRKLK